MRYVNVFFSYNIFRLYISYKGKFDHFFKFDFDFDIAWQT